MQRLILLLAAIFSFHALTAQAPVQMDAADVLLNLQKLNTVGSVLYIAAHPDDENTRLLAYLARERKLRTAYLSLTRGDGGQNLIGKEQGDALGLIRTQELLAARRIDGAEQFFTRANDFGFSKSPDETLSIWGHDSILSDVVWIIRKFRPDVIICRFPTTGEGGHGHHTASAILALEAFEAAADPQKFPAQLAYAGTWQAKRIFWNTFNFGSVNTTAPDQLKIDVGVYNPLLGKSYGEIASESRSMHKSQGFGTARSRGKAIEFFKLLKGDTARADLFSGVNTAWSRFPSTAELERLIAGCIQKYDPRAPQSSVPALVDIYKNISALDEADPAVACWKKQKLKEATDLLLACWGLWLEALADDFVAVPGNDISVTAQVVKRNDCDAKLLSVKYVNSDTVTDLPLKTNELYTFKRREKLPASVQYSNPYWLNEKHTASRFVVSDPMLIGTPENEPAAHVVFGLDLAGLKVQVQRPVVYKRADPVKGEVYRPLEVLPAAVINSGEKVLVFNGRSPKTIQLVVQANAPKVHGVIDVRVPEGWKAAIAPGEFTLAAAGDEAVVSATITPSAKGGRGVLRAEVKTGDAVLGKSITRIAYDHIPAQFILSDAETQLVSVEVKPGGKKIGYIPGAGDDVAGCLEQIGYDVTILNDELLRQQDLSRYAAIVTGVRAYNTSERLQAFSGKLLGYVKNGGNLLVQYNTNNRIGPLLAKIGPYPFTITRDRVTDERAEVRFLKPAHPAFHFPNEITAADFDGWIQERGIYFAGEADSHYETLLSMNDPGEKPSDGSIIVAKYGKGNFVYTGLAFFRELPAGVTGAYRLFANLLALPHNR